MFISQSQGLICFYHASNGALWGEYPVLVKDDEVIYDGITKGYYENGGLMLEIHYKNGKAEGISKWYYESDKLFCETPHKDGKIEGVVKTYHENGKLDQETLYKNDHPVR